ncbi:HAMP domain-containing sensor histidine kinase [Deinococcus sp. YIM 134068]|uniref:sensor histidine kinase n=1 Tax=Deinococcus lichenicola TaxID=3118910 RepID=UPI002F9477D9
MSTGELSPPLPQAATRRWQGTLRAQFTLVIFLLAFLPNLVLTLSARPDLPPGTLLGWMGLAAATCGLVGYVLSGALLRPLSRLEAEVQGGDFAEPHDDDPAEIRALRGAFGELLARLGTEQGRRGAFMATLVHDLKTPLIATGHLTRTLTEGKLPDAERREVGEQILSENARLLALVGQMADAHRYEREDVRVQTRPTELRPLLDGVARRLTSRAGARDLTLTVTGTGTALADMGALERAVTNLADNALRYARTRVELAVTPAGVQVRDDGPGLGAPLAELAQPFNAQPVTIAGQQYTAGTAGLGLFIARRVAEAHGGGLSYERTSLSPENANPAPPHSILTLHLPEVTP